VTTCGATGWGAVPGALSTGTTTAAGTNATLSRAESGRRTSRHSRSGNGAAAAL
jgi:hypothetical protein